MKEDEDRWCDIFTFISSAHQKTGFVCVHICGGVCVYTHTYTYIHRLMHTIKGILEKKK